MTKLLVYLLILGSLCIHYKYISISIIQTEYYDTSSIYKFIHFVILRHCLSGYTIIRTANMYYKTVAVLSHDSDDVIIPCASCAHQILCNFIYRRNINVSIGLCERQVSPSVFALYFHVKYNINMDKYNKVLTKYTCTMLTLTKPT